MIQASGLVKQYNGVKALDNISFSCEKGLICGVIGHNGAGKTTLLKIVAGLIRPTSGEILINGNDIVTNPMAARMSLGYLPEESRLYDTMTVHDYLSFFGQIYGLAPDEIQKREKKLLKALELIPEGKKIGNLSKGMRRKVSIARSLLHDPSFLVYDEPTSGLDPMTSRFIIEYLKELRVRQKTMILSAHNLFQIEEICDCIMILRRGKMIAMGSIQDLRDRFGTLTYTIYFSIPDPSPLESAFVVEKDAGMFHIIASDIDEMNRVTGMISQKSGRIERIESHYPSLEDMLFKIGS
jgi:ABC-2 type transport system ATP-binding protein